MRCTIRYVIVIIQLPIALLHRTFNDYLIALQPWQVPASKVHPPEDWDTILAEINIPDGNAEGLKSQGSVVLDDAVKAELEVKVEPSEGGKPAKEQRKALTLKERLEVCQATERQRLSFCKVSHLFGAATIALHNWLWELMK